MAAPAELLLKPSGGDDSPALRAAIRQCQEEGIPRLVLQPGRYQLHPSGEAPHHSWAVYLDQVEDLTIHGPGALLEVFGVSGAFILWRCRNVTFEGLTLDAHLPAQSVGTVVAVGERQFDVQVLPSFPVRGGEPVEAYMDFDPQTRLPRARGVDNYYGVERTELVDQQRLRVFLKHGQVPPPGVLVALRHKVYGPGGWYAHDSQDLTFRDLTVYYVPGMAVVGVRSRDLTLERVRVLLKPGSDRLVSASADATHFGGCQGTITITDCEFEGMGDDAVNIKSGLYLSVRQRVDAQTVIGQHNLQMVDAPSPGDTLEVSHLATLVPYATVTVESAAVGPAPEHLHTVRLREPLPAELREGDVLGNATRAPRIRIRGTTVRRNRARGFLIQSRDAIVEDCHFQDVTGGGVWVMTEVVHFFESIGTRDVVVRRCTFDNCNYGAALGDGVLAAFAWLQGFAIPPQPGVHQRITFEDNTITGADNAGIWCTGVAGLTLRGNTVRQACRQPTRPETNAAVAVLNCSEVVNERNDAPLEQQGAGCVAGLRIGP
ncbi:MAG: right-handed parallel beta-helix repeat-containing protein [Fimbriimonadaceae bacterium]|nr:right-handed parallel beta-helix repeat-containing protein [Fimbriimonadaceae bacterium]